MTPGQTRSPRRIPRESASRHPRGPRSGARARAAVPRQPCVVDVDDRPLQLVGDVVHCYHEPEAPFAKFSANRIADVVPSLVGVLCEGCGELGTPRAQTPPRAPRTRAATVQPHTRTPARSPIGGSPGCSSSLHSTIVIAPGGRLRRRLPTLPRGPELGHDCDCSSTPGKSDGDPAIRSRSLASSSNPVVLGERQ